MLLFCSLTGNIGVLAFFKYAAFAQQNLNALLAVLGRSPLNLAGDIILPLGISFYTFQSLGYTLDVYRGGQGSCKNLEDFLLYVSFFPQLVAGPIERARDLLPQLASFRKVTWKKVRRGLELIVWGLVKKLSVADRLACFYGPRFIHPEAFGSDELLAALISGALGVYLDFSAYTDIARGSALLMGVRLHENFEYPLLATTPSEFWSRWHITLTRWLNDYVFTPLGGYRGSRPRAVFNLLFVMTLVGLWHGAAWTFIAWGILHGLLLSMYYFGRTSRLPFIYSMRNRFHGWITTQCLCIFSVGFFLSPSMGKACSLLNRIPTAGFSAEGIFLLTVSAGLFCMVVVLQYLQKSGFTRRFINSLPAPLQALCDFLVLLALLLGGVGSAEQFIYFVF